MEEKLLIKVWNGQRNKKTCVVLTDRDRLYDQIILKASQKLGIDGTFLVLESDGTVVDDSEALLLLCKETFLLLQKNEIWHSPNEIHNFEDISLSTCSTVTVDSNQSSEGSTILRVVEVDDEYQNYMSHKDGNKNTITENTWKEFNIPWTKMTDNDVAQLGEGKIDKSLTKKVIHLVVDEMRSINKSISNKSLRIIAHKIIDKFPLYFKDVDDDGIVLGDGSTTLFLKLQERYNYLNTCEKRKRSQKHSDDEPCSSKAVSAKRRRSMYAKVGAAKWSGDFDHTDVNSELDSDTAGDKVAHLKMMTESGDINDEQMYKMLEQTYNSQREFLNRTNPPTIIETRDMWPILLQEKGIFWHFNKLTGTDINLLEENLKEKAQKLINYGISKKITAITNEEFATENEKCYKTIETISLLFNENVKFIINHLKNKNEISDRSPSPMVVSFEDKDVRKFYVIVENCIINEGTFSLFNALKQCYAIFFIFNMQYPKGVSCTLEFLQRYFMKCHPDVGTKSRAFGVSKTKVITLMKKLALFETDN